MAWIFYINDDLPKNVYLTILLAIGLFAGITGVFVAQVKRKNIIWLKFLALKILSDLKNREIKRVFKLAINGNPDDEIYQQALKESSKELSTKMQENADEIIRF